MIAIGGVYFTPSATHFWLIGGTIGAVVLRIVLIAVIAQILLIPFLQALGGLVLVWIAIKLVRQDASGTKGHKVREVATLWEAIGIVIVADLIMSLDNVLAVAATAHGELTLVLFGIGLSIPIVICGSSLLARLMDRFRWIVWLGGGVLGRWVAGDLAIADTVVRASIGSWDSILHWALPSLLAATAIMLGWRSAYVASR